MAFTEIQRQEREIDGNSSKWLNNKTLGGRVFNGDREKDSILRHRHTASGVSVVVPQHTRIFSACGIWWKGIQCICKDYYFVSYHTHVDLFLDIFAISKYPYHCFICISLLQIGFILTVLLSLAVLLTIITDKIPSTSIDVSVLCTYGSHPMHVSNELKKKEKSSLDIM